MILLDSREPAPRPTPISRAHSLLTTRPDVATGDTGKRVEVLAMVGGAA